jgi:predicted Zn-dependent peptidase
VNDVRIPVERRSLDNGLRVVLSVDESAPIVAVNLWYGVGSRDEREGRTGFAHLFEHMMFQGSAHVPDNGHIELVERAGGSMNGSTWFDRTNYYETVPSHHLELALWLEADRMGWLLPALTQEKLDNQRDVVKNEKRQRYDNQPYGDWDERVQRLTYPPDHPYHHTVIGSMEDLDAAGLEDVESFFSTYYVPNNCVLTIAGDFDPDEAMALVERHFAEIPAGAPVPPIPGRTEIDPLVGDTLRERVVSDVPLPRTIVVARIPPVTSDAHYAADVASGVLGSGRASRMYRSLVRDRKVAKDVVVYPFPLTTGQAMLLVWATGYPGTSVEELEEALVGEMEGLASVGQDEVERALALAEARLVRGLERVERRADLLSMFTTHFDDPHRLNGEMERLRAVTPGDVRELARDRLGPDNRVVVQYVPRGDA